MHTDSVRIYTPESRLRHPLRLFTDMFRDVVRGRELAWRLAVRDVSAQYRQTALGLLWVVILPLANTLVWVFLSRNGVVVLGETAIPYGAYVFTGTMLWAILTDALTSPLQQTVAARAMLAKINFPREALVLSGIYQTLFNAAIRIALTLLALFVIGVYPGWGLLLFPLAVVSLVLAGTAIGLLLTPMGVLYTDVGRAVPLLMQFLMYFTPVVFPMPETGPAAAIFGANPLTPLVLTARDWLTGQPALHLDAFLAVNLGLLAMLFIVAIAYRVAMPLLIERMGS